MDRDTLVTAVRNRCGIPTDDGLFPDAVMVLLVNQAVKKVGTEYEWPWLETTETINSANGTSVYSVATGYVSTVTIFASGVQPLKRIDIEEADWWGTTNTGTPKAFAVAGRQIRMVPTPSSTVAYTHRYVATEIDLASGASVPLAPEPWMNCIIEYAAYLAFRRSQNQPEAGAAKAAYEAEIEVMKQRTPTRAQTHGGGQDRPMPKADAKP